MLQRLLLLVGLLTLVGCQDKHEGAVKLTVSYSGFKPGCIRVSVKDEGGAGKERTTELAGKGEATGGQVTVAAFREAGWSPNLLLTAQAFEVACTDTPVSTATQSVKVDKAAVATLELALSGTDADQDGYVSLATGGSDCDDGNPRRYKDAPELCNAVDDDCDSLPDDGLNVGSSCTGAGGCGGKLACNAADAGVRCDSPTPVVLYPDNDNDTRGKADAGVSSCEPTRPGHVSNGNDCDDTRATVYVGAPELCDTQDNDCDGTPDDGLDLGASCPVQVQGCSGKRACATDGGVQCDYVTQPNNYYPDDDLDQHGKADAGVLTCGPKPAEFIAQAGDCNDGNPYTHASRGELCDQEDNNCNGTVDEGGVCPTDGAAWVDQSSGNNWDHWRSVSLSGDGGVWVTGPGNRLRYRAPGAPTFNGLDDYCVGDSYSVWADPQNGTAFLGGRNQLHVTHSPTATTCGPGLTITTTDVLGVVGVPRTGGGTELHFVGDNRNDYDYGRALWWNGTTLSSSALVPAPLRDVHGISRDVLFAVGGYQGNDTSGVGARIYRFKPAESNWAPELVQDIPGVVDDQLRGIWVVHPKLAYAVGESNSVLRWNGTTWSPHSGPNAGDLYSVVAFGTSSVYVSTENGRVYRYDGNTWSAMPGVNTGAPLWDIAGTSPADLWVVGESGKRFRWPR